MNHLNFLKKKAVDENKQDEKELDENKQDEKELDENELDKEDQEKLLNTVIIGGLLINGFYEKLENKLETIDEYFKLEENSSDANINENSDLRMDYLNKLESMISFNIITASKNLSEDISKINNDDRDNKINEIIKQNVTVILSKESNLKQDFLINLFIKIIKINVIIMLYKKSPVSISNYKRVSLLFGTTILDYYKKLTNNKTQSDLNDIKKLIEKLIKETGLAGGSKKTVKRYQRRKYKNKKTVKRKLRLNKKRSVV
jgi:hypothetical protein